MDQIIKIFKVGAVVSDRQYLLGRNHRPSSLAETLPVILTPVTYFCVRAQKTYIQIIAHESESPDFGILTLINYTYKRSYVLIYITVLRGF